MSLEACSLQLQFFRNLTQSRKGALKNFANKKPVAQGKLIYCAVKVQFLLAYCGAFLTGIIGYKMVQAGMLGDNAALIAADAEKVMPVMVVTLFNPLLAGILLSGAVSAMMSTASSQLLICASSVVEDILHKATGRKLSDSALVRVSRLVIGVVGVLGLLLAFTAKDLIYYVVGWAWAGIGCTFSPVVILAFFWRRMNGAGVLASMVTGTVAMPGSAFRSVMNVRSIGAC